MTTRRTVGAGFVRGFGIAAMCAAVFAAGGCGLETDTSSDESLMGQLEQELGGMDAEDEAPNFGDEAFSELGLIDDDTEDDGAEASAREELQNDVRARLFSVLITWGNHKGIRKAPIKDWEGSLAVEGARVHAVRPVLFERITDRIMRVDLTDQSVAWRSKTAPHVDGMLVVGVVPTDFTEDGVKVASQLVFVSEGVGEAIVVPLDGDTAMVRQVDEINDVRVQVQVGRDDVDACARGRLVGRWHTLRDGLGTFRGRWVGRFGVAHGYLKGLWGRRSDGERVFFGKYVGPFGGFRGLLAGKYDPESQTFAGKWLSRNKRALGELHGRYVAARAGDRVGGYFGGLWSSAACHGDGPSTDPNANPSTGSSADSSTGTDLE